MPMSISLMSGHLPRFRGAISLVLALACTGICAGFASAAASAPYRLVRSVPLGQPDDWDYVVYQRSSDRVFVAHGNRLTVVDERNGRIIGEVGPIPGGPHGIAFDRAAGIGITDDGQLGQAVLFNLKTYRIIKRLKIQRGADAVVFDPVSGHAFVIDGRMGQVAVIDPSRQRVVTFIHVGGDLEYAVAGDNGKLYLNGVTHHEIFRINTATNRVDAAWAMPQCRDPGGLAIDAKSHRLFSSCGNQRLMVVNAADGAVITAIPIGRGTDADRFDPKRRLIFTSNGFDGTLSIIREINANTFVPVATVKTEVSGRTMGIDPANGRVFIAAARTTPQALKAFYLAWRAGKRLTGSPFAPDSLHLLFFDPQRAHASKSAGDALPTSPQAHGNPSGNVPH